MRSPNLAAEMLQTEEQRNPGGRWARKQLIDWTAWRRVYGTVVSNTERGTEKEFTIDSFVSKMIRGGDSREQALQKWAQHKSNPSIMREGEGAGLILWIPQARKRLHDRTCYIENAVTEGSKEHKGLSAKDGLALKDFCHTSVRDHADDFFKGAFSDSGGPTQTNGASQSGPSQPLPLQDGKAPPTETQADPPKRRKKIDIMSSRTCMFASQDKEITYLVSGMVDAVCKATQVFEESLSKQNGDVCLQQYLQMVTLRRLFIRYWHLRAPQTATKRSQFVPAKHEQSGSEALAVVAAPSSAPNAPGAQTEGLEARASHVQAGAASQEHPQDGGGGAAAIQKDSEDGRDAAQLAEEEGKDANDKQSAESAAEPAEREQDHNEDDDQDDEEADGAAQEEPDKPEEKDEKASAEQHKQGDGSAKAADSNDHGSAKAADSNDHGSAKAADSNDHDSSAMQELQGPVTRNPGS